MLALALLLDSTIATAALPHRDFVKKSKLFQEFKELGELWVSFCIAVSLGILHTYRWRAALLVAVSALIAGTLEMILKWAVGRTRPVANDVVHIQPLTFDPFRGGLAGFAHQSNLCFPSGHALLAFSTAGCLAYLCPRGMWVWYLAACLVGLNRIGELAHYPSDVVGAALLGVLSSVFARRILGFSKTASAFR